MLIACEESQRVCIEFRKMGHEAYSCDFLECSGGHPEWHIQADAIETIYNHILVKTCDGNLHHIDKWDLIIAHPPCTYLTVTGNRIKFTDRQSAREYMKYLYDRGFDVELHRDDMKTWIEKMERGVDCGSHDCYN